tara:strand:- start:185 stop:817 length:633 start_codon:yes stop_codon:yes gene_type:complete
MLWNKLIRPAQNRFRLQRAHRIKAAFPQITGSIVVDIGGALPFWRSVGHILKPSKVIIYNISRNRMAMGYQESEDYIETHLYDGNQVPLEDGYADLVLCNSVIEHVPREARANLASEIKRIGRHFVVQTPSPKFPLELHFGLPFIHWLPRKVARKIVPISPFSLLAGVDAQAYFDQTILLPESELRDYFPGARIEVEWAFGFPKSLIAFG